MRLSESFARTGFARFINSPAGRITRIVAGIAIIIWGYTNLPAISGVVTMALGCVPLVFGSMDWCLIAPLLGGPISGRKVREIAAKK